MQARCRAAQDAAFLCCKDRPATPQDNTHNTNESNGLLSLYWEMQLARYTASISLTNNRPNRVTAVCVEVDQDRAGVNVRQMPDVWIGARLVYVRPTD
jgi:hypothetical protein